MIIRYNNFVREKQGKVADGISRRLMEKQRQVAGYSNIWNGTDITSSNISCLCIMTKHCVNVNFMWWYLRQAWRRKLPRWRQRELCWGNDNYNDHHPNHYYDHILWLNHFRYYYNYHIIIFITIIIISLTIIAIIIKYILMNISRKIYFTKKREAKQRLSIAVEDRRLFRFDLK